MALTPWGLALILVCLSAPHVSSQEIAAKVSTTSLVLTWEKTDQWEGVNTFKVKIEMNGFELFHKTILCFRSTCTFNSEKQGAKLAPCSSVSVTVSGGGYTAPKLDVITAPESVTAIEAKGPGNMKTITWNNPTSSCLKEIAATVVYGGYYNYTSVLGKDETSLTVPLCMKGLGSVKVQARGGSGESDTASVSLVQIGDDAIKITDCPPEGCTDVVINWKYKPVCPDVDHLSVILSNFSTTTSLTITTVTVTGLDINTKYDACLYAYDKDEKLLAGQCTKCGTRPEVADKLRVTNVTDTTAFIEWEPPICPTADEFEYMLSYSNQETPHINTTDTSFLWTDLNSAAGYSLCVTVLHKGVPSAIPACVYTFTLPAAAEEVLVKVYQDTSLFITWPPQLFMSNLRYRVSWGDELESTDYTEYYSYTIDGYNKTMGPNKVCVQVETKIPVGLRSTTTCQKSPFPNFTPAKPDHTNMIIGVSVSAGVAVLLSVVLVVVAKMQERPRRS